MKKLLKLFVGLVFGAVFGLILAGIGIVLLTDTSLSEYIGKLCSASRSTVIFGFLVGIVSFWVSFLVLITVHEAGHLAGGLLGGKGYKFVSFRIGKFTFIRQDGHLKIKKYSIGGTGGQCLLAPPEGDAKFIPTTLYNAGGVLANIICLVAVLPLLYLNLSPFAKEAILIFILTDVLLIILNGVPMKMNGVCNDGMNILQMRRNINAKRAFLTQLRVYAMNQNGMRIKDIPEEMLSYPKDIDYKNAMEVSQPMMYASWLTDRREYTKALELYEEIYSHRYEVIPLYVREMACEMIFLYLVTGQKERAIALYDKDLEDYISKYRRVMSAKERILCAIALYIENDRAKAEEIYEQLLARRPDFLIQGEVESDLALMRDMLEDSAC